MKMSHLRLWIWKKINQPLVMSSVKSLNNASPYNTKFFTVQGKIFLGPASPKTEAR